MADWPVVGQHYAQDIGDGTTTTFTVTHNFATTDVHVVCIDKATGKVEIADWAVVSSAAVSVGFTLPPAASGGVVPGGTGKRIVVTA